MKKICMLNHPIIHNNATHVFNKSVDFSFHGWLALHSGLDYWEAREFSEATKPQYLWFNPLTAESEIVDDHVGAMLDYMNLADKIPA